MFNLREFVKGGLYKAIGYMNDYQIMLNAAGWYEKGVLTDADLAELQAALGMNQEQEQEQTEE